MAREILIADGNKAAHKAFEEIFKETHYNLIFSENGEDALLKMKLSKPALVIADVTMPDKNGKELCQVFKEDPNLNKVPFVLLGGPFDEDIEEEKKQVRADGTITKPLQREPILKLVDGLLMAEPGEGMGEIEEEILELQPMAEVTESASSKGEEEIIDLLDIIEEPAAKPEEVPPEAPGEAMISGEGGELGEAGAVGEKAIADLELPVDMELPKAEEAIQMPEMERPGPGFEIPEKVDVETEPAEMEGKISPEEEMVKAGGIEKQYPGPLEGTFEPEAGALGAEETTEELPTEGMGELPQDVLSGEGLEEALAQQLKELSVERTSAPEATALEAEESTEELSTEGIGELPQDVLRGKGLEEALSEEIEELPGDLLGEKEPKETRKERKDTPDREKAELEGVEELGEETEVLREEEEVLEEALRELPGESLEEGKVEAPPEGQVSVEEQGGLEELGEKTDILGEEEDVLEETLKELPARSPEEEEFNKLSGGDISTDEFEWQPEAVPQEVDFLEGLAEKVLREEDLQAFGEEGQKEEGLEGFTEEVPTEAIGEFPQDVTEEKGLEEALAEKIEELPVEETPEPERAELGAEGVREEVFKEGELEKLAEEATRDQETTEIAEGALAEAIEEFTGETVREGEERVQPSPERPVQETISGAIKELVEGVSAKVLPKLTEAIAAAAAESIEKTVRKIVPAMAEEAIQKEIQKLEKIKKEEEFDV